MAPAIAELAGGVLAWRPDSPADLEQMLFSDGEAVAVLRFTTALGANASVESADGCWIFERSGAWDTRVLATGAPNTPLAVYHKDRWGHGGNLEVADGSRFRLRASLWQTSYDIMSDTGRPVAHFDTGGVLRTTATVDIARQAQGLDHLPWIVLLGWYLAVMIHRDFAAAITVTGPVK